VKYTRFLGAKGRENEHIIRNDDDYNRVRAYILDHPRAWQGDQYHPSAPLNRDH
jgi:hypothetical protein